MDVGVFYRVYTQRSNMYGRTHGNLVVVKQEELEPRGDKNTPYEVDYLLLFVILGSSSPS